MALQIGLFLYFLYLGDSEMRKIALLCLLLLVFLACQVSNPKSKLNDPSPPKPQKQTPKTSSIHLEAYDSVDPVTLGNKTTYTFIVVNTGKKPITKVVFDTEFDWETTKLISAIIMDQNGTIDIKGHMVQKSKIYFKLFETLEPLQKIIFMITVEPLSIAEATVIGRLGFKESKEYLKVEETTKFRLFKEKKTQ